MDERNSAYMHNCIPNMEIEKENHNIMQGREKSSTIYQREKNLDVTLDDFELKKVIG